MQQIRIKRGKLGRFRWLLYRNGKYQAGGRVWGHGSRRAAEKAAITAFGGGVEIETEDEGPLFAGERDFG